MSGDASDVGWFNYAVSYLRAAQALQPLQLGTTHPHSPVEFLYYHSIELFLQAYLVLKGATVKELKSLNHGVVKIAEECASKGLALDAMDREVIGLIEHQGNLFKARYLKTGYFQRASFTDLDRVTEHIMGEVAHALRAPGRPIRP